MDLDLDPERTDAALFDMDGTLLDSHEPVVASWTIFAEEHGLDVDEVLGRIHGVRAADTIGHYVAPDRVAAESRRLLDRELTLTDGIVEIAGAGALLRALGAAGIGVAVVTSAPRDLALARLAAAGLPVPPVLVTGDDVERGKPAPDGYLQAAEKLGADPARCAVFEDAEAGVLAGLAAGARVVVMGEHASASTEGLERLVDYRAVTVGGVVTPTASRPR